MSNSSLVDYVKISPNRSTRTHKIDTVTVHCIVGQQSPEVLGAHFAKSSSGGSSNYGIGPDGRIGMYVEEKDRAWTSNNWQNDDRAVTIEVASDTKYPYAVKSAAYDALIDLLVDICKRNGIPKLLWKNDKSLIGQVDKQNMTVHRWFAYKECPGEYLFSRHYQIADAVNARLGTSSSDDSGKTEEPKEPETPAVNNNVQVPFTVNVTVSDLTIRKGPGEDYGSTGKTTGKGIFTIVEVTNGYGRLKSGAGWIPLNLSNVNGNSDTTSDGEYTKIMGEAVATIEQMRARVRAANPNVPQSVIDMIPYYISEGKTEGVRGDVAFAQSCIETGNFTFNQSTCAVSIEQNNFAMMGVTGTFVKGESFATPQLGIRAQIQHLKAYASTEPLVGKCIDPRFTYVSRGCAPYVEWLGMKENPKGKGWASAANYGPHILRVLDEILNTKVEGDSVIEPDEKKNTDTNTPFTVNAPDVAIKKGPGESYGDTGYSTGNGIFTIVEVSNGFGKLKSGAGWIPLDQCTSVTSEPQVEKYEVPFTVKVDIFDLSIRKGPGDSYDRTGAVTGKGIFTIVEVSNGYGRLKSGAGWIPLSYVEKL